MVLIGVVALLTLGVAWLVITGDDAAQPASERPDRPTADAGAAADGDGPAGASTDVPTAVQATAVPQGVQVAWTGAEDTSYVVTVLSPDRSPEVLPAITGTSLLVPNALLGTGVGHCFTVAAAAPDPVSGAGGTPSTPACTEGASIDGMQVG